jgi:excisionase family DNA binding protein
VIEVRVQFSDDVVEAIAQRAADIAVARLGATTNESDYLTVEEGAALIRASRQRIYDLCSDGRLTRFKDGSRLLLSRAELVAHVGPTGSRSRSRTGAAQ